MIAVGAVARQRRAALLGLLLFLVASLIALVAMDERQPPDKLPLQDIPPDILAEGGLSLYAADPGTTPGFSEDAVRQEAARRFGATAVVREVLLARLVESGTVPLGPDVPVPDIPAWFDQVVWVVSYDPASTGNPLHGWRGPGPAPQLPPPRYHLMFLDTNTGEFLFAVSH